jgi:penicillin-binding protein 1C
VTSRAPRLRLRATLAALALAAAASAHAAIPSFEQVRASWRSSETVLLDRHGNPVQTVRTDLRARRGAWVPLAQISPALRAAAIASEDQRFLQHGGVDWQAVAGAAVGRANPGGTRGASTITMQLAGLLDPDLALTPGGRSVGAKIEQAAAALRIERTWSKEQILEAWLNLVPFRGEQVGVAAMSQALFQKAPSGLNAEESAIAAALLRAPNAAPAVVGQRACGVLKTQGRGDACVAAQGFAELVLARPPGASADAGEQLAPHFARQLVKPGAKSPPATLRTTLDAGTQRRARDALRQQLAQLRDRDVEDGAVVVLDNASGDVLAWVGASGELSQAAAVDAVVAPRQAGSTLKPFLYEQAIEQRWLTAASVLDDAPTRLHTPSGLYIPQNYDHDFKGPVSVRTALGSSLNVPAVRTAVLVSPDRFARRLVALGLPIRKPGDFYGYSIALGSPEVTLLSLANAYRALANGGVASAPRLQPADSAPAAVRVMDGASSFIVADILSDNGARAPTFGLDNALATRYWSAVKTGTSKDMRDNWCVGFSARYTVGVWVGNAGGAPMHAVSGVTGAAPVWRTLMDALQRSDVATEHPGRLVPASPGRGAPTLARDAPGPAGGLFQVAYVPGATADVVPGAPTPPAGLVAQAIAFDGQVEPARTEWFLAGTETARIALASPAGSAARLIASPDDRSIIALDPDMPPAVQRLRFEAVAPAPAGAWWRLDGRRLAAARPLPWAPWPGHHELALLDAKGAVLDTVTFDVRGAQAKPPAASARKAARPLAAASRPGA